MLLLMVCWTECQEIVNTASVAVAIATQPNCRGVREKARHRRVYFERQGYAVTNAGASAGSPNVKRRSIRGV